ncbi:MAG: MBL fold metallo-hydrolase [Cyanobacteria bacterium]|nr:MBL fold metallo-hydrolase [Cyanobacteriota bacterium]
MTLAIGFVLAGLPVLAAAQPGPVATPAGPQPLAVTKGSEYTLEKWADGVYLATGGTGSQSCVIVNDQDVLLFDVGTTPGGARALLEDVKLVSDKPVRTVVNSHFHYDHAFGNGAFSPDVQIIGHRFTQTAIKTFDTLHREPYQSWINRAQDRNLERSKEIVPIAPTVTLDKSLVLKKGNREIRLLFLGRGHTAGDVVLFLPKERIVCSGDLIEGGISYMGDGYFDEWVTTLEAMKQLDWAVCLPGHGRPFSDKAHVTALQSYLTDVIDQVARIRAQNVPAEEALKRLDLSAHEKNWLPRMRPLDMRGMRRIYQWLEERAAR